MRYISNYPNRTACDVLREMRKSVKTLNFSYLPGLIEELQTLVNRMEASLEDQNDLDVTREQLREARAELKQLDKQIKEKKEIINE